MSVNKKFLKNEQRNGPFQKHRFLLFFPSVTHFLFMYFSSKIYFLGQTSHIRVIKLVLTNGRTSISTYLVIWKKQERDIYEQNLCLETPALIYTFKRLMKYIEFLDKNLNKSTNRLHIQNL
jgi:hypothetical protein